MAEQALLLPREEETGGQRVGNANNDTERATERGESGGGTNHKDRRRAGLTEGEQEGGSGNARGGREEGIGKRRRGWVYQANNASKWR